MLCDSRQAFLLLINLHIKYVNLSTEFSQTSVNELPSTRVYKENCNSATRHLA